MPFGSALSWFAPTIMSAVAPIRRTNWVAGDGRRGWMNRLNRHYEARRGWGGWVVVTIGSLLGFHLDYLASARTDRNTAVERITRQPKEIQAALTPPLPITNPS